MLSQQSEIVYVDVRFYAALHSDKAFFACEESFVWVQCNLPDKLFAKSLLEIERLNRKSPLADIGFKIWGQNVPLCLKSNSVTPNINIRH
jgi:hypothetical protein